MPPLQTNVGKKVGKALYSGSELLDLGIMKGLSFRRSANSYFHAITQGCEPRVWDEKSSLRDEISITFGNIGSYEGVLPIGSQLS